MMWPKLLIVVTCLYLVQASVVPSIFDDEENTLEDNPEVSDCNWGWCTQHCRQRGYPYGSCINGRCECYRRRSDLPAEHPSITENENPPDDELVTVTDDEAIPEVSEARSDDCDWRCEQNCRQRGYEDGTCINGRCQCYRHRSAMHAVHPLLSKFEDCNWSWCEQHCRSMGYPDGTCRNGNCQCYRHRSAQSTEPENTLEDKELNPEVSEAKLEDCNWNWCEQHCRNMGYADGTCRNGRCQCYRHRSAKSTKLENTLEDKEVNPEVSEANLEDCDWHGCDQHCRSMGFVDGTCRNGRCQCYRHRSSMSTNLQNILEDKEVNPEVSEAKLDDCNWNWCEQHCRNMRYSDGTCRNGRCQCYHHHRSAESAVPVTFTKLDNTHKENLITLLKDIITDNKVKEARSGDCNWRWCEQDCHQMGFSNGTCRNGCCECYHRHRSAESAVPAAPLTKLVNSHKDNLITVTNKAKLEDCSWHSCMQNCHQRGYPYGSCENGRCQCYMHRSELPSDHPSFQSENKNKDNLITLTNEASQAKVNTCNRNWCDQSCRRYGQSGGSCINGRCQCYRHRSNNLDNNLITLTNQVSEANSDDCNWSQCDQNCRHQGYSYGTCASGHCECYRRRLAMPALHAPLAKLENNHENEVSKASSNNCNWNWCNQRCRSNGYWYGTCTSGRCQCFGHHSGTPVALTKFENSRDNILITPSNEVSEANSDVCNWNYCNQICVRNGYSYGTCASGHCQCYRRHSSKSAVLTKFENTLEDNLNTPANELVDSNEVDPEVSDIGLEDCNWRWCEQHCRSMGFSDGTCRSGRCVCDHRRHSPMPAVPAPFTKFNDDEESVKQCSNNSCLQFCRHLGFRFSHCINGSCTCYR